MLLTKFGKFTLRWHGSKQQQHIHNGPPSNSDSDSRPTYSYRAAWLRHGPINKGNIQCKLDYLRKFYCHTFLHIYFVFVDASFPSPHGDANALFLCCCPYIVAPVELVPQASTESSHLGRASLPFTGPTIWLLCCSPRPSSCRPKVESFLPRRIMRFVSLFPR